MRRRIKNCLFFILFLTFILGSIQELTAQTSIISGKILDAESKLPLEGVTIKVQGTNIFSQSDENGAFL